MPVCSTVLQNRCFLKSLLSMLVIWEQPSVGHRVEQQPAERCWATQELGGNLKFGPERDGAGGLRQALLGGAQ